MMNDIVFQLAKRIRPDLVHLTGQRRISATADVLTLLYSLPLLVVGLFWLVRESNLESLRMDWQLYLVMGILIYLFNRLRFFFITEIRSGGYANSDGSLDGIAIWASILLLGPTALWLKVVWEVFIFYTTLLRERPVQDYWTRVRMFVSDVISVILPTLVALEVYYRVGGTIPIQGFSINSILQALAAVLIQYIGIILVYSGYMGYVIWALKNNLHIATRPAIAFFFLAISFPALANPFGILAAGVYAGEGSWVFLFVITGLLLMAFFAKRFSQSAEYSRQQANQLEQLEKLGRAILDAPPDASQLPDILRKHASTMFASRGIYIWVESKGILLHEPPDFSFDQDLAWKWMQRKNDVSLTLPRGQMAWNTGISYIGPAILCPITYVDSNKPIGFIFLELQTMNIPWDSRSLRRQLPAVQSLGAEIASAIHLSEIYLETLAMEKTLQELSLARTIQASFLPETVPVLPGWELAAVLEPARQIAGDYYDFIQLPGGKLGILIADVADKGLGSALYMALSSTLIRIFAVENPNDPARVFKYVNQHILQNARANLFVTVFFGILDPSSGLLRYANAGHTPPYIMSSNDTKKVLKNTGMPLGIDDDAHWGSEEISISSGEKLILYTDGVTDAQNSDGEFIDKNMIEITVQQNADKSTQEILQSILENVHRFVGEAPRFDDISLVILGRK